MVPVTPVPVHRRQIDRRERQAAAGGDLVGDRPFLEQRASPAAQQRAAADAHAGGVLHLQRSTGAADRNSRGRARRSDPASSARSPALPGPCRPAPHRRSISRRCTAGCAVNPLCSRRRNWNLPGLARRIAVRGQVRETRRDTPGRDSTAPGGIRVRQKLLLPRACLWCPGTSPSAPARRAGRAAPRPASSARSRRGNSDRRRRCWA